jgi:hypothetical protein
VLLGWFFSSATASADDTLTVVVQGLTQPGAEVVEEVAAPVTKTVEPAVAPVAKTAEQANVPTAQSVTKAVTAVAEPASKSVTEAVTSTVGKATEVVEETVKASPVAPVLAEPVARVTDGVRGVSEVLADDVTAPLVTTVVDVLVGTVDAVPGVDVDVPVVVTDPRADLPVLGDEGGPSAGANAGGAVTGAEAREARRLARSAVTPDVLTGRGAVPSSVERGAPTPSLPTRGPVPAGPQEGLAPAPNASSGGSAGGDAASTTVVVVLPPTTDVVALHQVQHLAAGPVSDPGSRPD